MLGLHISSMHDLTIREYRDIFNIASCIPLIVAESSEKHRRILTAVAERGVLNTPEPKILQEYRNRAAAINGPQQTDYMIEARNDVLRQKTEEHIRHVLMIFEYMEKTRVSVSSALKHFNISTKSYVASVLNDKNVSARYKQLQRDGIGGIYEKTGLCKSDLIEYIEKARTEYSVRDISDNLDVSYQVLYRFISTYMRGDGDGV